MLELGDEVVVVGHSFGGEVAVAVESEPRGRGVVDVEGMLLIDAIPQAVELGEDGIELGLMDGSLELEKMFKEEESWTKGLQRTGGMYIGDGEGPRDGVVVLMAKYVGLYWI